MSGTLYNKFLRTKLFPSLQVLSGTFTNLKFNLRGTEMPKNKVVIVEIDSDAIAQLGRWPWHRDITAYLIEKTFQAGARVVGLDMTFSEPDRRISAELGSVLKQNQLGGLIEKFETDYELKKTIELHKNELVLGWSAESKCQPAYASAEEVCITGDSEKSSAIPKDFKKFAYSNFETPFGFDQKKATFLFGFDLIANIQMFSNPATHGGFFDAWPDHDGYIRRTNLVMMIGGKPYPSLPLEMARIILKDDLKISLDQKQKISSISFSKSDKKIHVSPLGAMEINFRGPSNSFQYVRALQVMGDEDEIPIEKLLASGERKIASNSKKELLKDAFVLIGLSALGVFDMRAFPFDHNVPGVEGHANILDNILSSDFMSAGSGARSSLWVYVLMLLGALLFAYFTERLESIPALFLFMACFAGFGFFDLKVLFSHQINWNTSLFYLEMGTIFILTLAIKYVQEEKNKKFIKGAFSKYVAPAIVDSILKDPSKLSVGGEKRELSILFSDIRGFTTFSEKMDAKELAQFLNDYLGIMTDLVFDHEGTLDKYIGDAVMAFWGAPLDQPKHAANACRAAIQMQKALSQHQARFKEQYGVDVYAGIGINSGAVNVGNMGSERIFEYTVIGDHVNLASRMEGLTKPYGVTIVTSRFTFDSIEKTGEPLPSHRVLDFVKVKGKKKAVELIQLLEHEYSSEGLKFFQEGRELYTKQKWDEAMAKFEQANQTLRMSPDKMDGPCEVFMERCLEFKKNPPATDWDGSWEMTSK